MLREPRQPASPPKGGKPVTARKEGRFQVVKLEQRIAPKGQQGGAVR